MCTKLFDSLFSKIDYFIQIGKTGLWLNQSFPSFYHADLLCDPTESIWMLGTLFEAMTGRTAFINGFLVEVFRAFPQL